VRVVQVGPVGPVVPVLPVLLGPLPWLSKMQISL